MNQFEVWMCSIPGMYAQYDGSVKVYAENEVDAIDRALCQIKRTAFPDRDASMWRVLRVERVEA